MADDYFQRLVEDQQERPGDPRSLWGLPLALLVTAVVLGLLLLSLWIVLFTCAFADQPCIS